MDKVTRQCPQTTSFLERKESGVLECVDPLINQYSTKHSLPLFRCQLEYASLSAVSTAVITLYRFVRPDITALVDWT